MRTARPIQSAGVILLAATLAACGGQQQPEQENSPAAEAIAPVNDTAAATTVAANDTALVPAAAPAADAPPPAFAQCQSCHSPEAGKNGIGPSLAGVFGTKAAEVAGYDFSPAMTKSGLTWDEATLDRYLKAPQQVVPGTKMTFAGLSDDAKRAAVIAYLKSIG